MNRIKIVLAQKGIKQTWLAEKIGKSFNMTNGYVQNRRQPSVDVLFKIADALQVKASSLINDNYKFPFKFSLLDKIRDDFFVGHDMSAFPTKEYIEKYYPDEFKQIKMKS